MTQLPTPYRADGNGHRHALVARHHDEETIGLRDVLGSTRRRWWLLAAGAVLGAGLALAYAMWMVPVYEASASIRVDKKSGTLPAVYRDLSTKSDIRTELEVLGSRTLAARVADSLRLRLQVEAPRRAARRDLLQAVEIAPTPAAATYRLARRADGRFDVTVEGDATVPASTVAVGEMADLGPVRLTLAPGAARHAEIRLRLDDPEATVRELRERVQIDLPDREASIVELSYRDRDPRTARDIVDLWTRAFIEDRQGAQHAEARSTAAFLREQLDTLSAELAASEEAYAAFREREQVVSPEVQASTQVTQLAALRAERNRVEAERRALADLLAEVEASAPAGTPADSAAGAEGPSPYRRLIAFPTLLRNQVTSELLRSLAQVETERATLLQRRMPSDPDVQILTARVRELEEQLRSIATTYLDGLTLQVASLDSAQAPYDASLRAMPRNEMLAARLGRSPRVLEAMVTMLQTRLKEAQIAEAVEDPSVRVVDAAVVPIRPVRPNLPVDLLFGVFAGLLLGGGAALTRDRMDHAVRTRADVQWASGVPVVGVIPSVKVGKSRPAILETPARAHRAVARVGRGATPEEDARGARALRASDPRAHDRVAMGEAYARLQLNLAFSHGDAPVRTVLFASAVPGEGKTTSAVNFALTLARRGLRTVLVDADLRRGTVAALFGEPEGPGLADVLRHRATLAAATRTVELEAGASLDYVARGAVGGGPAILLDSAPMREVLATLAASYDRVVLDSPPLNIVTDAALLATQVEGVVVVARSGRTDPEALGAAIEQLRQVHAPLLGTLLNDADPKADRSYEASYRYLGHAEIA